MARIYEDVPLEEFQMRLHSTSVNVYKIISTLGDHTYMVGLILEHPALEQMMDAGQIQVETKFGQVFVRVRGVRFSALNFMFMVNGFDGSGIRIKSFVEHLKGLVPQCVTSEGYKWNTMCFEGSKHNQYCKVMDFHKRMILNQNEDDAAIEEAAEKIEVERVSPRQRKRVL